MPATTFSCPDLTTFLGLGVLGLTAVRQLLTVERAVIECRVSAGFEDPFCERRAAPKGRLVGRWSGAWPTCRRLWKQDTSAMARLRARLTHSAVELGLRALGLGPCRSPG